MPKALNVFITGKFRSGTTLLVRALDAHPEITAVYQPCTPFFMAWRNLFLAELEGTAVGCDLPMGLDWLDNSAWQQEFIKRATEALFSEQDVNTLIQLIRRNFAHEPKEKPQFVLPHLGKIKAGTAGELLGSLLGIIGDSSGINNKVVCLKETWCEEFIEPILKLSGFKCIHIVRDPRAVLASRNTGNHLKSCGDKKYPILFIARSWRRSVKYIKRCQNLPGYDWVKYEDLIQTPEKILRQLCGFMDVDFHKNMICPSRYKDGQRKPWQPNSTSTTDKSFNKAPLYYWEHALTKEEIGVMELLCAHEMEELGYHPINTDYSLEDFMSFKEDQGELVDWIKTADLLLTTAQKEKEFELLSRLTTRG